MQSISYREQSDKRQYGGMLMLLGFCAIIQPMANLVSAFGPDGANVPTQQTPVRFLSGE